VAYFFEPPCIYIYPPPPTPCSSHRQRGKGIVLHY